MEDPCCTEYPELLPLPDGDPIFGKCPIHWASWRKNAAGACFLATDFSAIPADKVPKDDLDDLFPGHEDFFPQVVSKVLQAASGAGVMNHYEALPQEQVSALRLLMQASKETCSWAAEAVDYLVQTGCYTEAAEEAADLQQQAAPKRASIDSGDQSASKKRGRPLYADEEFDLFSEGGKAPVGAGKLPV